MVEAAHFIDGLSVPKFVVKEHIDKLKDFKLYEDDVWIVGYPRTGVTWAQHIVRMVHNGGEPDERKISDAVPWLEIAPSVGIEKSTFEAFCPNLDPNELPRPRAFKSHFPYGRMVCGPPNTTPCKYIYTSRNPKDVFVSLYFMMKWAYRPQLEWDSFWDAYIAGNLYYGDYMDHLLSWWSHRNDDNVLFLKYEDMKKDLKQHISKIASFIGKELPDDKISAIADLASFEKMKKDDTVNYSWDEAHIRDGEPMFLRKGILGDWKTLLSEEQSAQMDAICDERLKDTGLEFEFQ